MSSSARNGLPVVTLIRSSPEDFDQYRSVQATSPLDWIEANPGHTDIEEVRGGRREAVEEMSAVPFDWGLIAARRTTG